MAIDDCRLIESRRLGPRPDRRDRCVRILAVAVALLLQSAFGNWQSAIAQDAADPAYQQFLFAYRLLQAGDDKLATEAFDDYLGRFSRHMLRGDALYYRGLLARRAGDTAAAARLLGEQAEPRLVPAYAVALLRGQVYNELKRYDEALLSLENLDTSKLDNLTRTSTLLLLAQAYQGAGNAAAAVDAINQAAALDSPLRPRALIDKARLQAQAGKTDDALKTLDAALQATAADQSEFIAEAARLAGDLAYQAGKYADASRYYDRSARAGQTTSHFGAAVLGQLWSQFSARQVPQVVETYTRLAEALPPEQRLVGGYLAGSALQEQKQYEQAAALLEAVAPRQSSVQDKAMFKLAVCYFELGRYPDMQRTVDGLLKAFPQSPVAPDALFLLAAADARQGDVNRGAQRLATIIDKGPDEPYYFQALLQRARLYEQHNILEPAVNDYIAYLKATPYERVGQTTTGEPRVKATDEQADAFVRLLDLAYRAGMFPFAQGLAQQWIEHVQMAPLVEQEALFRGALANLRLRKFDEARALLDRLGKDHPTSPLLPEARYHRGLVAMSQGNADAALPDLLAAAGDDKVPAVLRVNALRLAAIRQREAGRGDDAAKSLDALEKLAGLPGLLPEELLWRAERELQRNKPDAAIAFVKPILDQPNSRPEDRAHALFLTGQSHAAAGRSDDAATSFERVVALGRGYELQSRLALAESRAKAGRHDEALAEFEGLLNAQATPIAAGALYGAAQSHRALAHQATQRQDAAVAAERRADATRLLKRLVLLYAMPQLEPLPQRAYVELADLAREAGQEPEAIDAWRSLQQGYGSTPWGEYARAMLLGVAGKKGDATYILDALRKQKLDPVLAAQVDAAAKEWR